MRKHLLEAAVALLLMCTSAFAQTTGTVSGRILDHQGAAIPGVTVTAKNPKTGSREWR